MADLVPPTKPRRTPLRVALITFGVVIVVGLVGSLVALAALGNLHDHPEARGEKIGQGLATFAVFCSVVAYLIQRKRIS